MVSFFDFFFDFFLSGHFVVLMNIRGLSQKKKKVLFEGLFRTFFNTLNISSGIVLKKGLFFVGGLFRGIVLFKKDYSTTFFPFFGLFQTKSV